MQSGHIWQKAEFFWLQKFLRAIRDRRLKPLVSLPVPIASLYRNHWSMTGEKIPGAKSRDEAVYLPGKNILLISHGAVFCSLHGISHLAIGPLKTNPFPDAAPSFFKAMGRTLSKALSHKIQIHAPFRSRTKNEVMKLGKNLPLELTFSCLNPKGLKHCGQCNKCAERKKAFRDARLPDRTTYRDGSFHHIVSK